MTVTAGEGVQRVQKLLESLEQKSEIYQRAVSNLKRVRLHVEEMIKDAEEDEQRASNSLEQIRTQLEVELVKLDPALFIERREDAEREKART